MDTPPDTTPVLPLSFSFIGIEGEQFAFFSEHAPAPDVASGLRLHTRFPFQFENRLIGCELIADFHQAGEENVYLRCGITCLFQIAEKDWIDRLNNTGDILRLDRNSLVHFAAFTTGTLRGVLHVKQQNIATSVLLPPLNIVELISSINPDELTFKRPAAK